MPLHYTSAESGGWLAVCAPTRLLLVGGDVDDATVASLWHALCSAEGTQQALELLTRHGLAATPPFALVETGENGRAIVRGAVTVTVTGVGGVASLSGAGVTTWTERLVGSISALAMAVAGASGQRSLPLDTGVVVAASVDWVAGAAAVIEAEVSEETVVVAPRKKSPEPVDVEATVTELPAAESPAAETAAAATPAVETAAVESGGAGTAAATPAVGASVPESSSTATEGGYDYLFGDTVFRTVAGAAVVEEPAADDEVAPAEEPASAEEPAPAEVRSEAPAIGDHDGMTVMTSDIAKLRSARALRKKSKKDATPAGPVAAVLVLALPNGARETLSQPILVGRAPSVSQVSGGMMPKLITIGNSDQDISRTHARFVLEGDTVVVTDLHSRNGTVVKLPGKEPQKLRAGEPTSVLPGTIVDFGGGLTLRVDED